jgi:hypothetical protein
MAMTPEGAVKAKVKLWLKARGIWYFMPASNGMGKSGVPDFICCVPSSAGGFLAIETKAPGKRKNTTAMQDQQITAIREAGGVAVVIDDVTQLEGLL